MAKDKISHKLISVTIEQETSLTQLAVGLFNLRLHLQLLVVEQTCSVHPMQCFSGRLAQRYANRPTANRFTRAEVIRVAVIGCVAVPLVALASVSVDVAPVAGRVHIVAAALSAHARP